MIETRHEDPRTRRPVVLISCSPARAAERLARSLELLRNLRQARVVVDLTERDAAEADLLHVLRRFANRAREDGGSLAVVCPDSHLRSLLDVTLLSRSFGVYATREEALAG